MNRPIALISALALALALTACSPQRRIAVRTEEADTAIASRHRTTAVRDTVRVLLTDTVQVVTRGDTVYVSRWRDRWHQRTLTVHDTLVLRDTVRTLTLHAEHADAAPSAASGRLWPAAVLLLLALIAFIVIRTL